MLLCVDIGNTNITLGFFDGEALLFTARLSTRPHRTADQFALEIKNVVELNGSDYLHIEDAVIGSVVPEVGLSVSRAISKLCNIVPLMLGPGVKTGLNIKIDNPAQLGADLVAGAVGALDCYTTPCIIIDMGTATTVSVLDSKGQFLGGIISAGVGLTVNALVGNTSLLPSIDIEAPKSVIGSNTVDCMKSGIIYGSAAMLDGLINRIENEMGTTCTVVATGGKSRDVIAHCTRDIIYNENLLLDGLRLIYEKNT